MGGVFCKKSGKWGVFFCKKSEPFLNAGCIMYSISIFILHFTYSGDAYVPNAPPAYGPGLTHPLSKISGYTTVVDCLPASTDVYRRQQAACSVHGNVHFRACVRRFYGFTTPCWLPPYLVAPCDQLGDAIASTGCRNVGAMISQYNCVDGARCLLPTAFKDSSVRTTASAP